MQLITLTFDLAEEDREAFTASAESLLSFWDDRGFTVSLFQDASHPEKFTQLFLTEKSVDDFTDVIQNDPETRVAFESLREMAGHVVISVMERIV